MKKLIYENAEDIQNRKNCADELVKTVNDLLIRYKDKFNFFGQTVDEAFALQLLTDPLGTFDELLRVNAPLKPVAGKPLDIKMLATLTGIDREGFIKAFTIVLPGSKDRYNRTGAIALFKLKDGDRAIIKWDNGVFSIDEPVLNMQLEYHKIYAESREELKELEYWEGLCTVLNAHLDRPVMKGVMRGEKMFPGHRPFIDKSDVDLIAGRLGLKEVNGKFDLDRWEIAKMIKSMKLVN